MNVGFQIPSRYSTEPAEDKFDLRAYVNFIWRHWIFIVSVAALSFLTGLVYLARTTPLYTATAQVLLEPPPKNPGLETVTDNVQRLFHRKPAGNHQIGPAAAKGRRSRNGSRLPRSRKTQRPQRESKEALQEASILQAINSLRGALAVSRSGYGQVLNISITSTDPARAGQLANAVANAYFVNQLDARFEAAKQASGWLSDRLVELRQQLRDSEEAVTKFRNEHGLARSGPTVALNEQQLGDLNSKLIAARTDVAEKKTRVDFLADVTRGKKSLNFFAGHLPVSG